MQIPRYQAANNTCELSTTNVSPLTESGYADLTTQTAPLYPLYPCIMMNDEAHGDKAASKAWVVFFSFTISKQLKTHQIGSSSLCSLALVPVSTPNNPGIDK